MAVLGFLRRIWRSKRVRIVVTSLLVGIGAGVVELAMPLEDLLLDVRTVIRRQPAPQDIVVVELDDASLTALGETNDVPRSADAKLIQNLLESGVKRIFFDRTYQFPEEAEQDQILIETLQRYPGQIFLGALPEAVDQAGIVSKLPAPKFREHVGVTSLEGYMRPFGWSWMLPIRSAADGEFLPSMSAKLAGKESGAQDFYRPDFSYDVKTVPRFRYVDVVRGQVPADDLAGKDVVIGLASINANDIHPVPFQGNVPGAFIHVLGAQTLKRSIPISLGWLPALVLAAGVIITGMRRGKSFDRYRISGFVATLLLLPLVLDHYSIEIEVFPAALAASIAIFRSRALDRVEDAVEFNAESGLPSLQSLRSIEQTPEGSLVAMKVRNYGAILGSFSQPIEAQLASQIVRRIQLGEPDAKVYHEGDTFFWLSRLANPVDLLEHLEGLHLLLQNGVQIERRDVDLSFNCGVETDPRRPLSARISSAMQAAEQAVRDDELVGQYDGGNEDVQWDISLMSSLDRAIDNGEVWVAYQPKLDLAHGQIKGAEALVRWTHPERGPISPEKFIQIAEEYHRIEKITQFVLNEAVRSAAALLHSGYEFSVSVNISAQLLRNPGLPKMISDVLEANELPPQYLILEITETDRLDRGSKTLEMMRKLVESGLQLSIDDFGTGNATIDYLRIMPASEVKIDKVFVSELETSKEDYSLVQSIIEMAHSLDRRVVAEGVENQRIMSILHRMKCDQIQGFHIGLPQTFEGIRELVENSKLKKFG